MSSKFGLFLREQLKAKEVTQTKLAAHLGVSKTFINDLLCGDRRFSKQEHIEQTISLLGLDANEIYDMIAEDRGDIPIDLRATIMEYKDVVTFIRALRDHKNALCVSYDDSTFTGVWSCNSSNAAKRLAHTINSSYDSLGYESAHYMMLDVSRALYPRGQMMKQPEVRLEQNNGTSWRLAFNATVARMLGDRKYAKAYYNEEKSTIKFVFSENAIFGAKPVANRLSKGATVALMGATDVMVKYGRRFPLMSTGDGEFTVNLHAGGQVRSKPTRRKVTM